MFTRKKLISLLNYYIILTSIVLGVVLYDFIQIKTGMSFFDELIAAILLIYYFAFRGNYQSKSFLWLMLVFIFYLVYSFYLKITVSSAIWMDFFIQIKPFIAFFCAYQINIHLIDKHKKIIARLCLWSSFGLFIVGLFGDSVIASIFSHPSRFATAISILGALYFYSSKREKLDILVMFIIFTIGLFSTRSKFYAFYLFAVFLFLYKTNSNTRFKFSYKFLAAIILSLSIVLYIIWDKFSFYFLIGAHAENIFARPLIYMHSIDVLNDFFPFGSGFGTYATHASAEFYSPLYYKYQMHLSPEIGNGLFISDTFLPSLVQYGYLGILLFFIFWRHVFLKIINNFRKTMNVEVMRISLLILVFFAIESIADSTFTHNRGMVMLIILAMYLNEGKVIRDKV